MRKATFEQSGPGALPIAQPLRAARGASAAPADSKVSEITQVVKTTELLFG